MPLQRQRGLGPLQGTAHRKLGLGGLRVQGVGALGFLYLSKLFFERGGGLFPIDFSTQAVSQT